MANRKVVQQHGCLNLPGVTSTAPLPTRTDRAAWVDYVVADHIRTVEEYKALTEWANDSSMTVKGFKFSDKTRSVTPGLTGVFTKGGFEWRFYKGKSGTEIVVVKFPNSTDATRVAKEVKDTFGQKDVEVWPFDVRNNVPKPREYSSKRPQRR